eukprot:7186057-Pyramimonas_sp.AAC.1
MDARLAFGLNSPGDEFCGTASPCAPITLDARLSFSERHSIGACLDRCAVAIGSGIINQFLYIYLAELGGTGARPLVSSNVTIVYFNTSVLLYFLVYPGLSQEGTPHSWGRPLEGRSVGETLEGRSFSAAGSCGSLSASPACKRQPSI